MILTLFASLAIATPDLPHTAETLDAGQVVVRIPTGPSAVGLADGTELWTIPFDFGIGGPRVGVEQRLLEKGSVSWTASPSAALRSTLRRGSIAAESTVSLHRGEHVFSAVVGADLRLLQRLEIDDENSKTWSVDRLQVPVTLIHDWSRNRSTVRTRVNVPIRDRGQTLTYGSGSLSYLHAFGKLHTETGVGLLVGSPRDQYMMDTYLWSFVLPYPKLDLWMVF